MAEVHQAFEVLLPASRSNGDFLLYSGEVLVVCLIGAPAARGLR